MKKRSFVLVALAACTLQMQAQLLTPKSDLVAREAQTSRTVGQMPLAAQYRSLSAVTGYEWIGYNQAAGVDTTIIVDSWGNFKTFGGMVEFNIDPFACDTVYGHLSMSPYGYQAGDRWYSFMPNYNSNTGTYSSMDLMGWDVNTWELTDSVRVRISKGTLDIPYTACYDPVSGLAYAITFGDDDDNAEASAYYSYIIDPATHKLKRLAKLGTWDGYSNYTDYKGMFTDGKQIYALEGSKVMRIDRKSGEATYVGTLSFEYNPFGLQAVTYHDGLFYIDHYDLYTGTSFLTFTLDNIGADGNIPMNLLCYAPTGYDHFFRKQSEAEASAERLSRVNDLKVTLSNDEQQATITFTVPAITESERELSASTMGTITLIVDDQKIDVPGGNTVSLGSTVSVTTDLLPLCLHYVSAQVSTNHVWSTIEPFELKDNLAQGLNFVSGYDAPGPVSKITLNVNTNGNSLKVSWKAPTTSRYCDFGTKVNFNEIDYIVLDAITGDTLAHSLTTTSYIDSIDTYKAAHQYTIIPCYKGIEGIPATSARKICGSYVQLPYQNDFSSPNSLELFTVINSNNDGTYRQWIWNQYYQYIYLNEPNGSFYNDDWLITPAFQADTEHVYMLQFDLHNSDYEDAEKNYLKITMGSGNTIAAQDRVLDDMKAYHLPDGEVKHYYTRFEQEGTYQFGIYDYSPSGCQNTIIDNLLIAEAFSVYAPDSVTELSFQPADGGKLSGTLFFTLPEKNVSGEAISTLSYYEVYRNDTLVQKITDAQPGSGEAVDVDALHGNNAFRVVAYNEYGNGWPVELHEYVGLDVPSVVNNLSAYWADSNQARRSGVRLCWEAPTAGIHGAFVDSGHLTYNVYGYDYEELTYELLASGLTEPTYTTSELTGSQQGYYAYAVSAQNAEGEGEKVKHGIVLGKALSLPFNESWYYGGQNGPWITASIIGNESWAVDNNVFNMKAQAYDGDAFQIMLRNESASAACSRISTPIISLFGAEKPSFGLWVYHDANVSPESWLRIDATTDGMDYVAITEPQTFCSNAGWTYHLFSLDAVKDQTVQLGITVYLADAESRFFADAFQISGLSGKDLAITGLSCETEQTLGRTTQVEVQVVNTGAQEVTDYEVCLYRDGEMIGDEIVDEPLCSTQSRTFTFTVPLDAAHADGLECYAEVMYDDDCEDNNISNTLTLQPVCLELNPVDDLTLVGGTQMQWSAPETMQGLRTKEDFELSRSFGIDGTHGWTCVDGDQQMVTYYTQYYNNYWPNYINPQAWMIWSIIETGTVNDYWMPINGDKCLISWLASGYYEDYRMAEGSQDDWFISPEVLGGTTVSFLAKAPTCSTYGPSTLQVLYSTTDRETSSFKLLEEYSIGASYEEEAESYSLTLPADARFVAFRNVYTEFAIMLDDIEYTLAESPQLLGYNVYCGFAQLNRSLVEDPTYTISNIGSYAVTALYDRGESALSNRLDVESLGIEEIHTDNGNEIYYSVDGRRIEVPAKGIYIRQRGNSCIKEIVK